MLTLLAVLLALEPRIRATSGPAWVGYEVPAVPGHGRLCCDDGLEDHRRDRVVKLEGPSTFYVYLRVEKGAVQKVKTLSSDCRVDTGGLPFISWTDVTPEESLDFLATLVRSLTDDAPIVAIALHDHAKADGILEKLLDPSEPEKRREKAAFWLGAARGKRGFEILDRVVRRDPSDRFREKVVFALYVSREPAAVESIIRVGKSDSSSRVRGQALFWLAQKAGEKSAHAITDAIQNDPETEVKKKAVFALSQLPKSEGVPLLIEVARTNKNPVVRKQAMFWLGQSDDPRALRFFEDEISVRSQEPEVRRQEPP